MYNVQAITFSEKYLTCWKYSQDMYRVINVLIAKYTKIKFLVACRFICSVSLRRNLLQIEHNSLPIVILNWIVG